MAGKLKGKYFVWIVLHSMLLDKKTGQFLAKNGDVGYISHM